MKVLIAISGFEPEGFFRRVVTLAALHRADEIMLVHVIDTKHRADLEFGRERHFTMRAMPEERRADLLQAEEFRAQEDMRSAHQALIEAGLPENRVRDVMPQGKPNEELRRLAEDERIDLIVVGGREGKRGPHSVGKTARFLIDHAPNAALLVR